MRKTLELEGQLERGVHDAVGEVRDEEEADGVSRRL